MFRSLAIVESQLLAVSATKCTLKIIVSLAAGVTRHLYVCTAAQDVMLAIIAPTYHGGDIANEAVITLFFLQPSRLLLIVVGAKHQTIILFSNCALTERGAVVGCEGDVNLIGIPLASPADHMCPLAPKYSCCNLIVAL